MNAVYELSAQVSTATACQAFGLARATYYRQMKPAIPRTTTEKAPRISHRALNNAERDGVLKVLHDPHFVDMAPREVYATLLDEGKYLCSVRSMYRYLNAANEVKERRNQVRRPKYQQPELLAIGPNQVWSWDITKLRGPVKWSYYYLYVMLDIFSRYVVGWMVAASETATLAKEFISTNCERQSIEENRLTIHSDRGSPMIAKSVAQLMVDMGVEKSHSRPSVSNDNPYSEAHFKTLKYRPTFPKTFGSIQDARAFCRDFFIWYNDEHYHEGIASMTPAMMHSGKAEIIRQQRSLVLKSAYEQHPERFVNCIPTPPVIPTAAWINPPLKPAQQEALSIH